MEDNQGRGKREMTEGEREVKMEGEKGRVGGEKRN